ncbi:MAG: Universal stress protein family [Solirubrobacteraceae bacterium]|jgi:nucleotide-binding universal stress UspA family protein|nr:Universal stress protein family [Solirubrobacteraceae bacterium]
MLQRPIELTVLEDRSFRPRVLNATSGSPASVSATAAAAVIASERDAELFVVHVRPPEAMRVGRLAPTIVRGQRLRDPHASVVLSAARQVAWANGAFARVMLMSGEPVPMILSLADELAVELIVIGASRSRWPAVLAARTRCRIQRDAPCPVRIVRLSAPAPAGEPVRTMPVT